MKRPDIKAALEAVAEALGAKAKKGKKGKRSKKATPDFPTVAEMLRDLMLENQQTPQFVEHVLSLYTLKVEIANANGKPIKAKTLLHDAINDTLRAASYKPELKTPVYSTNGLQNHENEDNNESSYETEHLENDGTETSSHADAGLDGSGHREGEPYRGDRGRYSGGRSEPRARGHTLGSGERSGLRANEEGIRANLVKKYAVARYRQKEGGAFDVYEIDNAELFQYLIDDFVQNNDSAASVEAKDVEHYKTMRLFVNETGEAGAALTEDGDIVSLFNAAEGRVRGAISSFLPILIGEGGRTLDCFDIKLPRLYALYGFQAVGRFGWDEQYKPPQWDKSLYTQYHKKGEPDVVFMTWKGELPGGRKVSPKNVLPHKGEFVPYNYPNVETNTGGDGAVVKDYDAGKAAQKAALAEGQEPSYSLSAPSAEERAEAKRQFDAVVAQWKNPDGTWKDGFMLAPNGQKTKLSQRQWLLVRTPNFKKWFGDWENDPEHASKVVDENGEPRVVYHGTRTGGFRIFDNTQGKRGSHAYDDTNFFAYSKHNAESYTPDNSTDPFYPDVASIADIKALDDGQMYYDIEQNGFTFVKNGASMGARGETREELEAELESVRKGGGDVEGVSIEPYWEVAEGSVMAGSEAEIVDWFNEDIRTEWHQQMRGEGGIYQVFLNIRNPYEAYFDGANWDGMADGMFEVFGKDAGGEFNQPILTPVGNRFFDSREDVDAELKRRGLTEDDVYIQDNPYVGYDTNGASEQGRAEGADGTIIYDVIDYGRYGKGLANTIATVYDATNIKSADGNLGTFSEHPDITYSLSNSAEYKTIVAKPLPSGFPSDFKSETFIRDIKNWILEYLPSDNPVLLPDENGEMKEVMIDKRGLKEIINHLRGRISDERRALYLRTIPHIRELLSVAKFERREPNRHGEKLKVYKYRSNFAIKDSNDKTSIYRIIITVKENLNGKFYYDHALPIKEGELFNESLNNPQKDGVLKNSDVKTSTTPFKNELSIGEENSQQQNGDFSLRQRNTPTREAVVYGAKFIIDGKVFDAQAAREVLPPWTAGSVVAHVVARANAVAINAGARIKRKKLTASYDVWRAIRDEEIDDYYDSAVKNILEAWEKNPEKKAEVRRNFNSMTEEMRKIDALRTAKGLSTEGLRAILGRHADAHDDVVQPA